jgi:hypothetical protein
MGGPQSLSERSGEEKISHLLPGLEHPIIQSVAQRYATELSRLLKYDSGDINVKLNVLTWIFKVR